MNSKYICGMGKCTACNACVNICPRKCISLEVDPLNETSSAKINLEKCIDCKLCEKVCPLQKGIIGNSPYKCFAAWSDNQDVRKTSASGGVAMELYRYFLISGGKVAGVKMSSPFEATFLLTNDVNDVNDFKNSKYVYSDTGNIYQDILGVLKAGESALFIGLPCQVAGLKNYLQIKKADISNLFTVDLICHGVTPQKFLMQHIQYVEKKCKRLARSVSFRNPLFDTEKFYFTLKDEGGIFYKKPVKSDDVYQIAYHSGISYRENCYSCNFANVFRQGDLTLGDFWSVGKTQEVEFEKKHISCILVNTEKGEKILKNLVKNNKIIIFERPIEEETRYERQLNSPTNKNEIREKFLKYYKLNKNFDKAMRKATFKIRYSNLIKTIIHYERIKTVLRVWIPQKYRTKFKQVKKNSKI